MLPLAFGCNTTSVAASAPRTTSPLEGEQSCSAMTSGFATQGERGDFLGISRYRTVQKG